MIVFHWDPAARKEGDAVGGYKRARGQIIFENIANPNMRSLIFLTFVAVVANHVDGVFRSLRIASLSPVSSIDYSDPEVVGGAVHDCYRECVPGDVRTCVYSFTLLEYTTMSTLCGNCPYESEDCFNPGCVTGDGTTRPVILVNHLLPGPSVQVCEGDLVQVDVINTMVSESASVHWHGMYQVETPWMDGVPYISQCPIHPHNSFKYNFTATPAGTHLYHSHSGVQETDGFYGSLIVRAREDPFAEYYDFDLAEHVMLIWHWFDKSSNVILNTGMHKSLRVGAHTLTINGRSATAEFEKDGVVYTTPRSEFTVDQGSRYRFRTIGNMAIYCPVEVSIDNHKLLILAVDGAEVEPVEVDTFIINAGERVDFVLTADQEVGNYWMRFRGSKNCAPSPNGVISEAVLRYSGAENTLPPETVDYANSGRSGVLLNPIEQYGVEYTDNELIRIADLNSIVDNHGDVSGTPDHVFYIPFAFHTYSEFQTPGPYPQFNQITFESLSFPLLTQKEEITADSYCTDEDVSAKQCFGEYCTCPYIYPVGLGSLVEMIIIDLSTVQIDDHPMHIHGQHVRVVAMEVGNGTQTVEQVKSRNEAGLISKKFEKAPLKDTVGVPAHGFAVLRFVAENPGYWFLHCHIAAHSEEGMAIVIKVGEHEDMLDPPSDFPKCGDYDATKNSQLA